MTMTICVDSSRSSAFMTASNMDGAKDKREKHQPRKFQLHFEVGFMNYLHHCVMMFHHSYHHNSALSPLVCRIRSCKCRARPWIYHPSSFLFRLKLRCFREKCGLEFSCEICASFTGIPQKLHQCGSYPTKIPRVRRLQNRKYQLLQ